MEGKIKYTISPEADKKIQGDMDLICKEIREKIPKVISIILTGGFSRGEGPVKKENGKFYPYNDYDIQVVSNTKLSQIKIDKVSNEISKKLGYRGIEYFYCFKKSEQRMKRNFYIDLKCNTPSELKGFLPRIRYYELRNHSRILYGKDVRNLIPNYRLDEIPKSEGAKLLLDRLSQLISYYSEKGEFEDEFLCYVIQQSYAACCTSLLLLSGNYQIGYKKSMGILKRSYKKDFPELYKEVPELSKKIEEFVEWKINPIKLNKDIKEEWFIAKNNVLKVCKYFFSKFLNKSLKNTSELSKGILKMNKEFYLPYLKYLLRSKLGFDFGFFNLIFLQGASFILKKNYYLRLKLLGIKKPSIFLEKSPGLVIFSSLPFIAESINRNGIDKDLLVQGIKLLKRVYPVKGDDWEKVTIDYTNAYIAFFLQKI